MKKTVILLAPFFCLTACGGPDPKLLLEHPHQVSLQLAPGRIIAENLYAPTPLQTQLNIGPVETIDDQTDNDQAVSKQTDNDQAVSKQTDKEQAGKSDPAKTNADIKPQKQ